MNAFVGAVWATLVRFPNPLDISQAGTLSRPHMPNLREPAKEAEYMNPDWNVT